MKAQIVSFHCVLKDPLGKIISSSFNNDVLTQVNAMEGGELPPIGAAAALAPYPEFVEPLQGLVEGLQGLKKGEKRQIFVSAARAYGFYNPKLVMEISRKRLPHGEALEVGYQVVTQASDGEHRVFRVVSADPLHVTLDGNHPLAGQDLFFDVEATSAREATAEEIAQACITPRRAPCFH